MNNYNDQDGCHNCKHIFVLVEYDDHPEFFCTLGAKERPMSGSIFMDEGFDASTEEEFAEKYDKWDEWSKTQSVKCYGICDNFTDTIPE